MIRMISSVYTPKSIFYGKGALQKLGEVTVVGGKKALIISDHIMDKLNYVDKCRNYLKDNKLDYVTYLGVETEPTDIYVREALAIFHSENCDVIISLGGGSCIDTAKAVSVLATNGGEISEYAGNQKSPKVAPVKHIAIPTTAGTGSEATDVTVITNTKDDVKMMIKDPAFLPEVAIVDPILSMSSPKHVTSATGIDALCHAIEAYISRKSHPYTDTLALSAMKAIVSNIRNVYNDGSDIQAREEMSLAALKAGSAFSNASVCLVHGMSRPIGALFHVPHGISNAMLLPAVLEFSIEACKERLTEIGRHIFPQLQEMNDEDYVAKEVVKEIKKLCFDLHIPNLKGWGIEKAAFDKAVWKMAKDAIASGSPGNNPRIPTEEEIVELYHTCYNYQMQEILSL